MEHAESDRNTSVDDLYGDLDGCSDASDTLHQPWSLDQQSNQEDADDDLYGDLTDVDLSSTLTTAKDESMSSELPCDNNPDLDLYDDLLVEKEEEQQQSFKELHEKFQSAMKTLGHLEKENKQLQSGIQEQTSARKLMEKNMASLLLTARGEITRKEREISDLRNRLRKPQRRMNLSSDSMDSTFNPMMISSPAQNKGQSRSRTQPDATHRHASKRSNISSSTETSSHFVGESSTLSTVNESSEDEGSEPSANLAAGKTIFSARSRKTYEEDKKSHSSLRSHENKGVVSSQHNVSQDQRPREKSKEASKRVVSSRHSERDKGRGRDDRIHEKDRETKKYSERLSRTERDDRVNEMRKDKLQHDRDMVTMETADSGSRMDSKISSIVSNTLKNLASHSDPARSGRKERREEPENDRKVSPEIHVGRDRTSETRSTNKSSGPCDLREKLRLRRLEKDRAAAGGDKVTKSLSREDDVRNISKLRTGDKERNAKDVKNEKNEIDDKTTNSVEKDDISDNAASVKVGTNAKDIKLREVGDIAMVNISSGDKAEKKKKDNTEIAKNEKNTGAFDTIRQENDRKDIFNIETDRAVDGINIFQHKKAVKSKECEFEETKEPSDMRFKHDEHSHDAGDHCESLDKEKCKIKTRDTHKANVEPISGISENISGTLCPVDGAEKAHESKFDVVSGIDDHVDSDFVDTIEVAVALTDSNTEAVKEKSLTSGIGGITKVESPDNNAGTLVRPAVTDAESSDSDMECSDIDESNSPGKVHNHNNVEDLEEKMDLDVTPDKHENGTVAPENSLETQQQHTERINQLHKKAVNDKTHRRKEPHRDRRNSGLESESQYPEQSDKFHDLKNEKDSVGSAPDTHRRKEETTPEKVDIETEKLVKSDNNDLKQTEKQNSIIQKSNKICKVMGCSIRVSHLHPTSKTGSCVKDVSGDALEVDILDKEIKDTDLDSETLCEEQGKERNVIINNNRVQSISNRELEEMENTNIINDSEKQSSLETCEEISTKLNTCGEKSKQTIEPQDDSSNRSFGSNILSEETGSVASSEISGSEVSDSDDSDACSSDTDSSSGDYSDSDSSYSSDSSDSEATDGEVSSTQKLENGNTVLEDKGTAGLGIKADNNKLTSNENVNCVSKDLEESKKDEIMLKEKENVPNEIAKVTTREHMNTEVTDTIKQKPEHAEPNSLISDRQNQERIACETVCEYKENNVTKGNLKMSNSVKKKSRYDIVQSEAASNITENVSTKNINMVSVESDAAAVLEATDSASVTKSSPDKSFLLQSLLCGIEKELNSKTSINNGVAGNTNDAPATNAKTETLAAKSKTGEKDACRTDMKHDSVNQCKKVNKGADNIIGSHHKDKGNEKKDSSQLNILKSVKGSDNLNRLDKSDSQVSSNGKCLDPDIAQKETVTPLSKIQKDSSPTESAAVAAAGSQLKQMYSTTEADVFGSTLSLTSSSDSDSSGSSGSSSSSSYTSSSDSDGSDSDSSDSEGSSSDSSESDDGDQAKADAGLKQQAHIKSQEVAKAKAHMAVNAKANANMVVDARRPTNTTAPVQTKTKLAVDTNTKLNVECTRQVNSKAIAETNEDKLSEARLLESVNASTATVNEKKSLSKDDLMKPVESKSKFIRKDTIHNSRGIALQVLPVKDPPCMAKSSTCSPLKENPFLIQDVQPNFICDPLIDDTHSDSIPDVNKSGKRKRTQKKLSIEDVEKPSLLQFVKKIQKEAEGTGAHVKQESVNRHAATEIKSVNMGKVAKVSKGLETDKNDSPAEIDILANQIAKKRRREFELEGKSLRVAVKDIKSIYDLTSHTMKDENSLRESNGDSKSKNGNRSHTMKEFISSGARDKESKYRKDKTSQIEERQSENAAEELSKCSKENICFDDVVPLRRSPRKKVKEANIDNNEQLKEGVRCSPRLKKMRERQSFGDVLSMMDKPQKKEKVQKTVKNLDFGDSNKDDSRTLTVSLERMDVSDNRVTLGKGESKSQKKHKSSSRDAIKCESTKSKASPSSQKKAESKSDEAKKYVSRDSRKMHEQEKDNSTQKTDPNVLKKHDVVKSRTDNPNKPPTSMLKVQSTNTNHIDSKLGTKKSDERSQVSDYRQNRKSSGGSKSTETETNSSQNTNKDLVQLIFGTSAERSNKHEATTKSLKGYSRDVEFISATEKSYKKASRNVEMIPEICSESNKEKVKSAKKAKTMNNNVEQCAEMCIESKKEKSDKKAKSKSRNVELFTETCKEAEKSSKKTKTTSRNIEPFPEYHKESRELKEKSSKKVKASSRNVELFPESQKESSQEKEESAKKARTTSSIMEMFPEYCNESREDKVKSTKKTKSTSRNVELFPETRTESGKETEISPKKTKTTSRNIDQFSETRNESRKVKVKSAKKAKSTSRDLELFPETQKESSKEKMKNSKKAKSAINNVEPHEEHSHGKERQKLKHGVPNQLIKRTESKPRDGSQEIAHRNKKKVHHHSNTKVNTPIEVKTDIEKQLDKFGSTSSLQQGSTSSFQQTSFGKNVENFAMFAKNSKKSKSPLVEGKDNHHKPSQIGRENKSKSVLLLDEDTMDHIDYEDDMHFDGESESGSNDASSESSRSGSDLESQDTGNRSGSFEEGEVSDSEAESENTIDYVQESKESTVDASIKSSNKVNVKKFERVVFEEPRSTRSICPMEWDTQGLIDIEGFGFASNIKIPKKKPQKSANTATESLEKRIFEGSVHSRLGQKLEVDSDEYNSTDDSYRYSAKSPLDTRRHKRVRDKADRYSPYRQKRRSRSRSHEHISTFSRRSRSPRIRRRSRSRTRSRSGDRINKRERYGHNTEIKRAERGNSSSDKRVDRHSMRRRERSGEMSRSPHTPRGNKYDKESRSKSEKRKEPGITEKNTPRSRHSSDKENGEKKRNISATKSGRDRRRRHRTDSLERNGSEPHFNRDRVGRRQHRHGGRIAERRQRSSSSPVETDRVQTENVSVNKTEGGDWKRKREEVDSSDSDSSGYSVIEQLGIKRRKSGPSILA